jgi:hypothetical protein
MGPHVLNGSNVFKLSIRSTNHIKICNVIASFRWSNVVKMTQFAKTSLKEPPCCVRMNEWMLVNLFICMSIIIMQYRVSSWFLEHEMHCCLCIKACALIMDDILYLKWTQSMYLLDYRCHMKINPRMCPF